jgi:hypothetical protein
MQEKKRLRKGEHGGCAHHLVIDESGFIEKDFQKAKPDTNAQENFGLF